MSLINKVVAGVLEDGVYTNVKYVGCAEKTSQSGIEYIECNITINGSARKFNITEYNLGFMVRSAQKFLGLDTTAEASWADIHEALLARDFITMTKRTVQKFNELGALDKTYVNWYFGAYEPETKDSSESEFGSVTI